MDSAEAAEENALDVIRTAASQTIGVRGIHDIHVRRIQNQFYVGLHLEVEKQLRVEEAHKDCRGRHPH